MNILSIPPLRNVAAVLTAAFIATPLFAQTPAAPTSAAAPALAPAVAPANADKDKMTTAPAAEAKVSADQPNDAELMAKMMELSKLGENHKLLAGMAGSWNYTVKMWMDPKGKPSESKGTATRKAIMDGRFFIAEHSGKFQMPGADGKMKDMNFKGMAIEGYDNVKQKFVVAWIDNMGTMILVSEGTYDAGTQTFTYTADCEMMPGMKVKIRETIKVVDKDHHMFEWYEDRGAGEAKTMEIAYTRAKK